MAYDWSGNNLAQQYSDRIVLAVGTAAVILAVTALPFAFRAVAQDEPGQPRQAPILDTTGWKLRR